MTELNTALPNSMVNAEHDSFYKQVIINVSC